MIYELSAKKYQSRIFIAFFLLCFCTLALLYQFVYLDSEQQYLIENVSLIIGFNITLILYFIAIIKEPDIDFFHPIHLITFVYVCIFFITPLLLISIGEEDCFGVDVMDGCIKATMIFVLSYLLFVIGYKRIRFNVVNFVKYELLDAKISNRILSFAYVSWFVGFLLSLYYLFITGRSLMFILTLGGQGVKLSSDTNMLFLSNFILCMIVPLIYIMKFGKSKLIFSLLTFLTFATMYVRGFRIFVLILILSLFIVYLKSNLKKASIKSILLFVGFLVIFFTILGQSRHGLRSGTVNEVENKLDLEALAYMFESNFDIYKPFYGLVTQYPENHNHTLGKSMVWDSLINWIPRSLWAGKPLAADQTMPVGLKNSVSVFAIEQAAMAWPNIAEFYMEFGTIGCMVLFYFFGYYSKKSLLLYYSSNINYLILYSVLFPLIFQFVIRGAFSQFIPFLVFVILPYIFINKIQKIQ